MKTGRTKEYNENGKEIFEGEYLNGEKWNGKGKDFSYDGKLLFENKLKYEIELLDGIETGKIREYNGNGDLEFEGKYLNSKRWNGKIFEYYEKAVLKFECEYINGEIKGIGKEYSKNGF